MLLWLLPTGKRFFLFFLLFLGGVFFVLICNFLFFLQNEWTFWFIWYWENYTSDLFSNTNESHILKKEWHWTLASPQQSNLAWWQSRLAINSPTNRFKLRRQKSDKMVTKKSPDAFLPPGTALINIHLCLKAWGWEKGCATSDSIGNRWVRALVHDWENMKMKSNCCKRRL